MSNLRFVAKDGEPDPEDKQALIDGLLSHHEAQGHKRKTRIRGSQAEQLFMLE